MNNNPQLFLISGMSGSGKSVALKVLEDSGFYCVDNLPAELLTRLSDYLVPAGFQDIAVSIDVRSAKGVEKLPEIIQQLKEQSFSVHLLFLDAQNDTLVKRFSETRRTHPLSRRQFEQGSMVQRTLPECVSHERELLVKISRIGHHIDTTELNANGLRAWIKQFIQLDRAKITILFQSFGFKHGIPLDADFVFDVRCLPNPYYNEKLRPLTGKDQPVIDFLSGEPAVQAMYGDVRGFVERWFPCFVADNRSYLTVAIGCTGGQHRSVYLAEKLGSHFQAQHQVLVRHRQLTGE